MISNEKDGFLIMRSIVEGEPPNHGFAQTFKEKTEDQTQEKEVLKKWYQFWKRG